jgi:hypothetical protein
MKIDRKKLDIVGWVTLILCLLVGLLGGEKARELRLCLSNISIISFIVSYVIKD